MLTDDSPLEGIPNFYACYLLHSLQASYYQHAYVGSTNDPIRRLRQHNGELTQGARKTTKKRPWAIAALSLAALQFEWAWQNPEKSRQLAALRNIPRQQASGNTRRKPSSARVITRYVAGAYAVLDDMLAQPAWCNWSLSVWLNPSFSSSSEALHLVAIDDYHLLPVCMAQQQQLYDRLLLQTTPCYICKKTIEYTNPMDWICCEYQRSQASLTLSLSLLPKQCTCCKCQHIMPWIDMIRMAQCRAQLLLE
ncbi:hypothetical protein BDF22DRAFT_675089 [Syncephalis plumigaleata]|nr:hypothetical protein BDF22DRAFT_675089 [Syncephalis plumigaleata]